MIEKRSFGVAKTGNEVHEYILKNKNGMEAHILDYGAVVKNLFVPDRNGRLDDVVLGFDDIAGYDVNDASHGAVVGRVGNRIGGGQFVLNDKTYHLDINNGGNCLHGGFDRYHLKHYTAFPNEEDNSLTLKRISPHMEQGFPGNLGLSVEYRLTEDNELVITYEARTDKDTPINLTNHTYFNLKGYAAQDLTTHQVQIRSKFITETDENLLPNGSYLSVEGTPMDLRELTSFMERQHADFTPLKYGRGFDHNYVLDHVEGEPDAIAVELTSGRKMEVFTDMPGVQFYTGNWLNENEVGKGGIPHKEYTGFCLETQFFPNSLNIPSFPDSILRAGEKFSSVTTYRFLTLPEA